MSVSSLSTGWGYSKGPITNAPLLPFGTATIDASRTANGITILLPAS